MYTVDFSYTREDWLAKRRKGIGGSDAPMVFENPCELWLRKTRPEMANDNPAKNGYDPFYWGNLLEEPIRTGLKELHDIETFHRPYGIHFPVDRPWQRATLDGSIVPNDASHQLFEEAGLVPVEGPGVLQIKTTSHYPGHADSIEDAPLKHQVQVQHELAASGYGWGILAVLSNCHTLRLFPFVRNDAFIDVLTAREEKLWAHVEAQTLPTFGDPISLATLRKLYDKEDGGEIHLDGEIWGDLDRLYVSVSATLGELEDQRDKIKQAIMSKLGNSSRATLDNGTMYSWKTQNRKEYTVPASSTRIFRRHASHLEK